MSQTKSPRGKKRSLDEDEEDHEEENAVEPPAESAGAEEGAESEVDFSFPHFRQAVLTRRRMAPSLPKPKEMSRSPLALRRICSRHRSQKL